VPSVLLNTQLADDQTLNIPADYLEEALMSGGCAALQFNDLKRRFGSANWQRYESFVARLAGQARPARRIQRVSRW
ncbi:MAG TPA: hypothetical protein VHM90_06800, partial [Phycisphaerae bacterium]|nr:hypothetical protein [Phycisphaerae bacterium]